MGKKKPNKYRKRRHPVQSKAAFAQRARREREKMVPDYDKYIKRISITYCCVAHCTSQFKKKPGVSFHQIPSNPEMRDKWMRAIPRKNWVDNSSDNCYRVCSNHFLNSDFNQGTTMRQLLKTAVPSVFEDYLEWLHPCKRLKPNPSDDQSTTDSIKNSHSLHLEDDFQEYTMGAATNRELSDTHGITDPPDISNYLKIIIEDDCREESTTGVVTKSESPDGTSISESSKNS